MTGESNKKKKKSPVPFRLNILFIIVFMLFSTLILKLGLVQIVNGQTYQKQVDQTQVKTSKLNSARGLIYDSTGTLLVGNKPQKAITFTRTKDDSSQDLLKLAQKLSKYITMDTKKVTERDKKDYWVLKQGLTKAYHEKLTNSEYKHVKNDNTKAYNLLLSKITKQDLSGLTKHDLQVDAIYRQLSQAMNLTPFYVKIGVKDKAYYEIGEHLDQLKGVNLTVTAARTYPQGSDFYFGSVGSIPKEKLDYFLVHGYNRNDKVGTSGLEQEYQNALNGTPTQLKYKMVNGKAVGNPKQVSGHRGYDLELTVNQKFQDKVQQILKDQLKKAMKVPKNNYLKSAFAVVTNPKTGGIISLNGVKYESGKGFVDDSYQTTIGSFAVGSTVKGATESVGYVTGTIPAYFNDMPIRDKTKSINFSSYSHNGIGTVTPETALEDSSNIFMAKIASNLAGIKLKSTGQTYKPTFIPWHDSKKVINAFTKMRNMYSEYGLGVKTGIDLPQEGIGYKGPIPPPQTGEIWRFAIGQYDTYSPIQVAQYMSTIANGGYRMQMHMLKSIREPTNQPGDNGSVVYQYKPHVLDHITVSQHNLNRIKKGLWYVTHGDGTSSGIPTAPDIGVGKYKQYDIAGKTGTADVFPNGHHTVNELFSGYAPANNPQIALTVIFPGLMEARYPSDSFLQYHTQAAGKIVQAYFQMKKSGKAN